MSWLSRHAEAIEAVAALLTACIALVALIAVPLQIRANAALQAEQSARDIYREFVALSVSKPQFAAPDYCALQQSPTEFAAYSYYIEYLLYTAEQVTSVSPEWEGTIQSHLIQHQDFFCSNPDWNADTSPVAALIAGQRAQCAETVTC